MTSLGPPTGSTSEVERRHGRTKAHFDDLASRQLDDYEASDRQTLSPEAAKAIESHVLRQLDLGPEDVVLDIGAGPGIFTRLLAKKAKQVVAVDMSAEQLRRLAASVSNDSNVEQIQADFSLGLPFESQTFEKVLLYSVVMYLRHAELVRGLSEVFRVSKPGAKVLVGDISRPNCMADYLRAIEGVGEAQVQVRSAFFRLKRTLQEVLGLQTYSGWYAPDDFVRFTRSIGFEPTIVPQPEDLPYHAWRYDCLLTSPTADSAGASQYG